MDVLVFNSVLLNTVTFEQYIIRQLSFNVILWNLPPDGIPDDHGLLQGRVLMDFLQEFSVLFCYRNQSLMCWVWWQTWTVSKQAGWIVIHTAGEGWKYKIWILKVKYSVSVLPTTLPAAKPLHQYVYYDFFIKTPLLFNTPWEEIPAYDGSQDVMNTIHECSLLIDQHVGPILHKGTLNSKRNYTRSSKSV